jgi:transposase-like protein
MVKSKGRQGGRRRLKGKAGRGTLEKERPPVFGMMQRDGQVVINLIANVKQKTIEPFIKDTIVSGTLVYTDEYSTYARLQSWGYGHKSVDDVVDVEFILALPPSKGRGCERQPDAKDGRPPHLQHDPIMIRRSLSSGCTSFSSWQPGTTTPAMPSTIPFPPQLRRGSSTPQCGTVRL